MIRDAVSDHGHDSVNILLKWERARYHVALHANLAVAHDTHVEFVSCVWLVLQEDAAVAGIGTDVRRERRTG